MKSDRQATEARHFACPKSYVCKDGREILHREDWIRRKEELWARAGGRCEYVGECGISIHLGHGAWIHRLERCWEDGTIPAHIIPRKDITQRDDRLSNLKLYCPEHDKLMERQSWRRIRSDKAERRANEQGKKRT